MNQTSIAALMKGIAPVLRDTITRALQPVIHRIVALESREPKPGERGEKGERGEDGRDGESIKGDQGDPGQDGRDGKDGVDAYPGAAKGLFDPAAPDGTYRALDVVGFNGSEWRAKVDNPGPLPGEGWMLSASRGKRGENGKQGERGFKGEDGKDGASFAAGYIDPNSLQLILARDDGEEVTIDLQAFAEIVRAALT